MYFRAHPSFPHPIIPRSTELPRGHLPSGTPGNARPPPLPRAPPTTACLPVAEIGVGITGFGAFFILLGALLYFDSVLLAFGNVSALPCGPSQPPRGLCCWGPPQVPSRVAIQGQVPALGEAPGEPGG